MGCNQHVETWAASIHKTVGEIYPEESIWMQQYFGCSHAGKKKKQKTKWILYHGEEQNLTACEAQNKYQV